MKRIFGLEPTIPWPLSLVAEMVVPEQHAPIHQPERNLEVDPPFHLMQREKAPGYAVFLLKNLSYTELFVVSHCSAGASCGCVFHKVRTPAANRITTRPQAKKAKLSEHKASSFKQG